MELAISNLVDNAVKFSSEGGNVSVDTDQRDDVVVIQVCDDGIGIEPEELDIIFERFYRGGNHTKSGSGLGLAIAKSVVEAHGGNVQVDSSIGTGSIFTLEIPKG